MTTNNSNSKNVVLKIIGISMMLVSLTFIILSLIPACKPFTNFFVGILGLIMYPLCVVLFLIGAIFISNKTYSIDIKYASFLLIAFISFLALLHTIISAPLLNQYDSIKQFGAYLSSCYTLTPNITIGGVVMGIPVFFIKAILGTAGTIVTFSISTCVFVGLAIDSALQANKYLTKVNSHTRQRVQSLPEEKEIPSSVLTFGEQFKPIDTTATFVGDKFMESARENYSETKTNISDENKTNFVQPNNEKDEPKAYSFDELASTTSYDPEKFTSKKGYITTPVLPTFFTNNKKVTESQSDEPQPFNPSSINNNDISPEWDNINDDDDDDDDDDEDEVIYPTFSSKKTTAPEDRISSNVKDRMNTQINEDIRKQNYNNENQNPRNYERPNYQDNRNSPEERIPNNFNSSRFIDRTEPKFDDNLSNTRFDNRADDFERKSSGRGADLSPRKSREIPNNIYRGEQRPLDNPFTDRQTNPFNDSSFRVDSNTRREEKQMQFAGAITPPIKSSFDTRPTNIDYKYNCPPTSLLTTKSDDPSKYGADYEKNSRIIETVLANFKIMAKVLHVVRGPAVTRYELAMPRGIPVRKILTYESDIAMGLCAKSGIRIEAPIPGKNAFGVEVPNDVHSVIGLKDIIESDEFSKSSAILPVAIGKNISGDIVVASMPKMVHMLIAGSTNSGKSVFLHNTIISLMYKCSPEQLRFIMIDPKKVEFSIYNGMPHLMLPNVVSEVDKAINSLSWAVKEMLRRYDVFNKYGVVNLAEYNNLDIVKSGEEKKLPYIVIIVDELNELMMAGKREVEDRIKRISQLGRAGGIHLAIATQRPSVEVVTGTIKANLPTRISFALTNAIDSRTILDESGAEKLLGKGDMLYSPQDSNVCTRLQASYITMSEVKAVVDYIREHNASEYDAEIEKEIYTTKEEPTDTSGKDNSNEQSNTFDELLPQALKLCIESNTASTSMIQRRFYVGYARASRIIDQMELRGYVSPANGSKAREVYVTMEQYIELFGDE
ncbi:MAG: DNA translocase FtsK [Clostridia bacterium]